VGHLEVGRGKAERIGEEVCLIERKLIFIIEEVKGNRMIEWRGVDRVENVAGCGDVRFVSLFEEVGEPVRLVG
jgi:hypothetical protein